MSELRWILLGFGVLIIAGVYFMRGRNLRMPNFRKDRKAAMQTHSRREPSLSEQAPAPDSGHPTRGLQGKEAAPVIERERPPDSSHRAGASEPEQAQGPQKIVVLHVAARGSQRFAGEDVVAVLQAEGLTHGRFDIFHWQSDSDSEPVFSVASMVEPGSFDLANIANITTPGLSLFLVLPGPEDAAESFSQMLITARNLGRKLGGEVLDEHGSSLSNQTAGHIREEIIAFQLRLRALEDMQA